MLFDTNGHCFERDIIMLNVRWYLSYKLSYRDLEEMGLRRLFFPVTALSTYRIFQRIGAAFHRDEK